MKQEYHINGTKASSKLGFYKEISRIFMIQEPTINTWNLDVLDDVLDGGFCIDDIENGIILRWGNFQRSKSYMPTSFMTGLLDLLNEKDNIELILE